MVTGPSYTKTDNPDSKQQDDADTRDRVDEYMREALAEGGMNPDEVSWQFDDLLGTQLPESPTLSDLGNARRLVHHHGGDIRYTHKLGRWYEWDGHRWRPDETGAVERRAKDTVGRIYYEAAIADESERKAIAGHARKSESYARIQAMISLAQSEPGIPMSPDELDRDHRTINVMNGTVDLETGEIRPHRRKDLISKLATVPFDPNAKCPEFEAFVDRIMLGRSDLVTFLQRALGYSILGGNSERVMFILYGNGRNGKSTLIEIMNGVLGDYSGTAPPEMLLSQREAGIPNDLARLPGTRFVSAVETGEGRRLDEAKVKSITGGDTITARFMRGEWFDFRPTFTLWLGTNHRPVIRGTDHAIWDRIRLIPFDYRVSDDEKIPDLAGHLIETEAAGILAWLVEGCLLWQAEGLTMPPEVTQANTSYRDDMDILAGFIDEHCILDGNATATAADLYQTYRSYCDQSGEKSVSQQAFGRRLTERGFDSARVGKSRTRTWIGIGLLQSERNFDDIITKNGHKADAYGGGDRL